jgi:thiamine-phosphate pyrophosphorylase
MALAMCLPRLYPILDIDTLARKNCPPERAAAAWLEAGARVLQFRQKGHWSRAVFEQAERIACLCQQHRALFIVNDRADMAMLLQAGLHLGQDDLPPRDARRLLGSDAVLGYSTHNAEQLAAAAAEPVTYMALGPIFATGSKHNPDPVVGIRQLRSWRALTDRPLVAIGGITRENVVSVLEAGADAVAVISDLLPGECTSANLRRRMEEWQQLTEK